MDGDELFKINALADNLEYRAEVVRKQLDSNLNEHDYQKGKYMFKSNYGTSGALYKLRLQIIRNCIRLRRQTCEQLSKLVHWLSKSNDGQPADPSESDQRLRSLINKIENDALTSDADSSVQSLHKNINSKAHTTLADYAARFEYETMARKLPLAPQAAAEDVRDEHNSLSVTTNSQLDQPIWVEHGNETQRLKYQLKQLEKMINEMQQMHQERIIREDITICHQNDHQKQLRCQVEHVLNEIESKRKRIQRELNQCHELLKHLKKETKMVEKKRKNLIKNLFGLKHKYEQTTILLQNTLKHKQIEMMDNQRKVKARRQHDLSLIRAYQLQKQQLKQKLIQLDPQAKAGSNDERQTIENQAEERMLSTADVHSDRFESDLHALGGHANDDEQVSEDHGEPAVLDNQSVGTTTLTRSQSMFSSTLSIRSEDDLRLRCLQRLHHDNRLCVRDVNLKMQCNQGAKQLSSLTLLSNTEGIELMDKHGQPIAEQELQLLQQDVLAVPVNTQRLNDKYSTVDKIESKLNDGCKDVSFRMVIPGQGTLISNQLLPMQARLLRFNSQCGVGRRFECQNSHIIRQLLLKSHCNLAQQVELFRIASECKRNPWHVRLFVHVEEQGNYTLQQFVDMEPFSLTDLQIVGDSLASGLMHLHDMGVAHSALSSHAVFIANQNIVKIGRLDCARMFYCIKSRRPRLQAPSPLNQATIEWIYSAPEVRSLLINQNENKTEIDLAKADVYSYGLLLWFCATRLNPTVVSEDLYSTLAQCSFASNQNFVNLVQNCLRIHAQERLNIFSALCHPFFNRN